MRYLCTLSGYFALVVANCFCAGMVAIAAHFESRGVVWWRFARLWGRVIYAGAWSRLRHQGFGALEWDQPCILMANHESYLDVPAVIAVCPTPIRFVARKEVFKTPILGQAMRATGQISVDRSDRNQAIQSLQAAAREIAKGRTVLVFPEGTRSSDGMLQSFKKGGFMLAIDAQVPILPIGISGTRRMVPRGEWRFQPGIVGVSLGAPISTAGLSAADRDDLMVRVRAALAAERDRAIQMVQG